MTDLRKAQPEQEPVAWDGACVLGHCTSPAGCEDSNCCRANYTAPVDAVNMSQERVDETAKGEHEPVAWFRYESSYEYQNQLTRCTKDCIGAFPVYTAPKPEYVTEVVAMHENGTRTVKQTPIQNREVWCDCGDGIMPNSGAKCGNCITAESVARKWVGLTDADIAKAMHGSVEGSNMLPYQFARAIEQALKEKNT